MIPFSFTILDAMIIAFLELLLIFATMCLNHYKMIPFSNILYIMIMDRFTSIDFWFKTYSYFIYILFLFLIMVSFQCCWKGLYLYRTKSFIFGFFTWNWIPIIDLARKYYKSLSWPYFLVTINWFWHRSKYICIMWMVNITYKLCRWNYVVWPNSVQKV